MRFSPPTCNPFSAMFSVFRGRVSAEKNLNTSLANQSQQFDTGFQKQCCCVEIHLQQDLVNLYGHAITVGDTEMDPWTPTLAELLHPRSILPCCRPSHLSVQHPRTSLSSLWCYGRMNTWTGQTRCRSLHCLPWTSHVYNARILRIIHGVKVCRETTSRKHNGIIYYYFFPKTDLE